MWVADVNRGRSMNRESSVAKGESLLNEANEAYAAGDEATARKKRFEANQSFQRATVVTSEMRRRFMEMLRVMNVKYIVAPYEGMLLIVISSYQTV
jgi:5'-3' exonuclease